MNNHSIIPQALLKKRVQKGDLVANLCYKDTEAKLFIITEEAPVEPPLHEDDMAQFQEKQEAFLEKWQGPVLAAYDKKYPKVKETPRKTQLNPTTKSNFFAQGTDRHSLRVEEEDDDEDD